MLCNVMHYCFCNSYVYRISLAKYLANVRNVMLYPSPIPLAPQSCAVLQLNDFNNLLIYIPNSTIFHLAYSEIVILLSYL